MANYFDNSQFSCRFGKAAPFKATTHSLEEITKQWTQMGLAYRHSEKSNTLQENTSKECFLGQIIFPLVSKRQKTNSSLIIKLFPSNVDFYLWLGGAGRSGGCLEFYKPRKFKWGNSGSGSNYSYKEKKKNSLLVCVFLFGVNGRFTALNWES